MLQDSDTRVLLAHLRERHDPLSWFRGDWPLFNHFYRPVSTLTFEFDNWAHGNDASGYGLTQAVIAGLCILLVFWVVRELSDKPWMAGAASFLFGAWHLGWPVSDWTARIGWLAAVLVWVAPFRYGWRRVGPTLMSSATLAFLGSLAYPPVSFAARTVGWLPGRTATVMTVFCLIATASYARFERLRARNMPPLPATAEDEPTASRTTAGAAVPRPTDYLWLVAALLALVCALGSYEQAVMLPGLLLGVAVLWRTRRRRPHWWPHLVFWAVLVGYLVLRRQLVPSDVSGYQAQQFRNGPGVWLSLSSFLVPSYGSMLQLWSQLQEDLVILVTGGPLLNAFAVLGNAGGVVSTIRSHQGWLVAFAWLGGFFAFLPMAWLKMFEHYYYWPETYWALMVVALVTVAGQLFVNAMSHPTRQAPLRPSPAPGSLPRQ